MIENIAYLHTGTNLGSRVNNLQLANQLIAEEVGEIISISQIYETEAWGITEQPTFLNQALAIKTILSPHELLAKVLEIELKMGRIRLQKWGTRLIDIDILFYENEVINTINLTIPHPQMQYRNFVLIPLLEIASQLIHPVLNKTIETLQIACEDQLEVKLF